MQAIHDNVKIFVTQRELQARTPKPDRPSAATTALQYVAENTGFDVITFRVDFSESVDIKLHRPAGRTPQGGRSANTLKKATQGLAFDCELHPFERRVLAYVVKKREKRAFVRVQYAVIDAVTPSVDVVAEAQERATKMLLQLLQRSNHTFIHVSKWKALPCRPEAEIDRACAEINRHFQDVGEVFVDASFPPTAKSLGASNHLSEGDAAVYSLCTWEHLNSITDSSWTFAAPKANSTMSLHDPGLSFSFTSGLPAQDSFLCAISIVAPYREMWLRRWFPSLDTVSRFENVANVPVALCDRGLMWKHLLVDLFLPSFPLERGLMAPRNAHGELYAGLLHKAYAKLKGSYAAVSGIPTINILQELTGSPWICLYHKPVEGYDTDPALVQAQLQQSVQATLSHRRRRRGFNSPDWDEMASLVNLELNIALVGTDFSLSPIEGHDTEELSATFTSSQHWEDNRDGVFMKQVVRTLSAGEYVVTVSAKRAGETDSHLDPPKAEENDGMSDKAVLTPASVDANLQLAFDCLDREGRNELSESDIISFIHLNEYVTPTQHGKEALRSFLLHRGSSTSPGSEERRLTLDDLRELYLGQAIQDCSKPSIASAPSSNLSSDSIRARFQELVWQDLLRLLPGISRDVEFCAACESGSDPRTEIECRDIVEMTCCFHSDTLLLSADTLPDEKNSLDSNNFNV